jgi:hypothetical protein
MLAGKVFLGVPDRYEATPPMLKTQNKLPTALK